MTEQKELESLDHFLTLEDYCMSCCHLCCGRARESYQRMKVSCQSSYGEFLSENFVKLTEHLQKYLWTQGEGHDECQHEILPIIVMIFEMAPYLWKHLPPEVRFLAGSLEKLVVGKHLSEQKQRLFEELGKEIAGAEGFVPYNMLSLSQCDSPSRFLFFNDPMDCLLSESEATQARFQRLLDFDVQAEMKAVQDLTMDRENHLVHKVQCLDTLWKGRRNGNIERNIQKNLTALGFGDSLDQFRDAWGQAFSLFPISAPMVEQIAHVVDRYFVKNLAEAVYCYTGNTAMSYDMHMSALGYPGDDSTATEPADPCRWGVTRSAVVMYTVIFGALRLDWTEYEDDGPFEVYHGIHNLNCRNVTELNHSVKYDFVISASRSYDVGLNFVHGKGCVLVFKWEKALFPIWKGEENAAIFSCDLKNLELEFGSEQEVLVAIVHSSLYFEMDEEKSTKDIQVVRVYTPLQKFIRDCVKLDEFNRTNFECSFEELMEDEDSFHEISKAISVGREAFWEQLRKMMNESEAFRYEPLCKVDNVKMYLVTWCSCKLNFPGVFDGIVVRVKTDGGGFRLGLIYGVDFCKRLTFIVFPCVEMGMRNSRVCEIVSFDEADKLGDSISFVIRKD